MSLDADERVTDELAGEIKAMLADPAAGVDGYELFFKVYYRGKWLRHGGFYPEKHLRLFVAARGRFGERAVHEAIRVDGQVRSLRNHVEHHTYRSVSDYLERMERYSSLSALEYYRQGRRVGPVGLCGRAAFTFSDVSPQAGLPGRLRGIADGLSFTASILSPNTPSWLNTPGTRTSWPASSWMKM